MLAGWTALYRPRAILDRIRIAATTRPKARDVTDLALGVMVLGGVFGPLGFFTGLLHWAPRPADQILATAALVLFVPALGEEIPFRAVLIPSRDEAPRAILPVLVSTALFTAWHGVETLWLRAERTTFLRWDFLAWAAALGFVCALLRRRSGSIWPPVALHWLAVAAWMGGFGGQPLF
jgi:predicted Abi (CAAX) family protease